MSCLTKSQLNTTIDNAFSDLIDNTALACEQIDTAHQTGLWMMGGVIELAYNSSTNTNTASWQTAYDTINTGTLTFNSAGGININYPTAFSSSLPAAMVATFNSSYNNADALNTASSGYQLSMDYGSGKADLRLSKSIKASGMVIYDSTTSAWHIDAYTPLGSSYFSGRTFNNTTVGSAYALEIDISNTIFKTINGLPAVTPVHSGINVVIPYVVNTNDASKVTICFWDVASGSFLTSLTGITGLIFGIDFGAIEYAIDMQTIDLGSFNKISVLGVFKK
ncbi:MAG: hypothetical protein JST82_01535 [Bacteroidetes bacterium]|nr:hypothetical protein [Bacteroidota bacterium]